MKIPLRARYFRSLVGLLVLSAGAFHLVFVGYEMREHPRFDMEALEEIVLAIVLMVPLAPIVLWTAWQIAGNLLRPLQAVRSRAERIRAGNLCERIPTDDQPKDELTRLADTLNHAFDRYAGQLEICKSDSLGGACLRMV